MCAESGRMPTSLVKKLGIKSGMDLMFSGHPDGFFRLLGPLPENCQVIEPSSMEKANYIHLFFTKREEMEDLLPLYRQLLKPGGTIWISWPKRTAGIETNLKESVIRKHLESLGLKNFKVLAIDQKWSALSFMVPTN